MAMRSTKRRRRGLLGLVAAGALGLAVTPGKAQAAPCFRIDVGDIKSNTMVADIDGDGVPEYLQGHGGPEGTGTLAGKVWKLTVGMGQWYQATHLHLPAQAFRKWDGEAQDFGARFLDVDGDGAQDLLVSYDFASPSQGGSAASKLYRNTGNGTGWAAPVDFPLPAGGALAYRQQDSGVRVADVDGDGLPDLVHAYGPQATIAGFPDARTLSGSDGPCYSQYRPRPATSAGARGQVYRMIQTVNGYRWSTTPDPGYVLPAGVFFVGTAPADAGQWSCPDGGIAPSQGAALDSDLGTQLVDVNGDGLPDLVKSTRYPHTVGASVVDYRAGANGVWLNTGRGWFRDPGFSASLEARGAYFHDRELKCTGKCGPDFMLLDVNDDGKADLLKKTASGFIGYLNTGTGWASTYVTLGDFDMNLGEAIDDFTGDGRPDVMAAWRSERINLRGQTTTMSTVYRLWTSSGSHPGRLSQITGPLGGKTRLSWKDSSAFRDSRTSNLRGVQSLVSRVELDTGPGTAGNPVTTYDYIGAKYDFASRESRGFAKVRAETQDGVTGAVLVQETSYHQDDLKKGLAHRQASGAEGQPLAVVLTTHEAFTTAPGVVVQRVQQTRSYEREGGPLQHMVTTHYEGTPESASYKVTEVERGDGAYGRCDRSSTPQGAACVASGVRVKATAYAPVTTAASDPASGQWILGLVRNQWVHEDSALKAHTTHTYDARGLPLTTATMIAYPGEPTTYATQIFEFGLRGNKIYETDALNDRPRSEITARKL